MKVKVVTREVKETELDIEYPVYLYFQDEWCYDELIAIIDERCKITVKEDTFGFNINYETKFIVEDHLLYEKNITTKEHFDHVYREAMLGMNYKLNIKNENRSSNTNSI